MRDHFFFFLLLPKITFALDGAERLFFSLLKFTLSPHAFSALKPYFALLPGERPRGKVRNAPLEEAPFTLLPASFARIVA